MIEEAAEDLLNYAEPGLDVFECLNRNEDDPHYWGSAFSFALDRLVHRMRQRYFRTRLQAEKKRKELVKKDPEHEYEVRETSFGKFLVMRFPKP